MDFICNIGSIGQNHLVTGIAQIIRLDSYRNDLRPHTGFPKPRPYRLGKSQKHQLCRSRIGDIKRNGRTVAIAFVGFRFLADDRCIVSVGKGPDDLTMLLEASF